MRNIFVLSALFFSSLAASAPFAGAMPGTAGGLGAEASSCAPAPTTLDRTAYAAVYAVNSTADTDDGVCSVARCTLRDAIKAANANPGTSLILFNIGSGPQVIPLSSQLPAVTNQVSIDGTFQPGYAGSPLIVLDGQNMVADGLVLSADTSKVKALVVCRFTESGIVLNSGSNAIQGNYVGVDPSGSSAKPNGRYGIFVNGGSANEIGGEGPGDGNVISGNGSDGLHITGGANNLVHGNRVGTDAGGVSAIPNGGSGVVVENSVGGQVGCTVTSARNVISGNSGSGVLVTGSAATGVLVGTNFIGTNASGSGPLANAGSGVRISAGAHGNTIGGTGSSDSGNRIAYNAGAGVLLDPNAGVGNVIQRNSIFSNGGLGIDLGGDGVTPNHSGPASGPNELQNFPTLSSAISSGGNTTISGILNSVASASFTVEFFSSSSQDRSGYGQGQTFLGSASVTTDGGGNAVINVALPASVAAGSFVTATATNSNGSTSEFSKAIAIQTTGSGGPCVADSQTLCLNNSRFKVQVAWRVPDQGTSGVGNSVSLTGDTGFFWFFSPNNIELVLKVVDGRAVNNHFWVFYGALSNVEYTITITDTATGLVQTYFNPFGQLTSTSDTSAFPGFSFDPPAPSAAAPTPPASPRLAAMEAACSPTATGLCLNSGRFQVSVDWNVPPQGTSGHGIATAITGDTGDFWFFSQNNVELVVKVLDGRAVNNKFWVFSGALTNVAYTITVTDSVTGAVRTYSNPFGTQQTIVDTSAF